MLNLKVYVSYCTLESGFKKNVGGATVGVAPLRIKPNIIGIAKVKHVTCNEQDLIGREPQRAKLKRIQTYRANEECTAPRNKNVLENCIQNPWLSFLYSANTGSGKIISVPESLKGRTSIVPSLSKY